MSATTIIACVLAWVIPGGGHLYLNRWRRGLVFLGIVLLLFFLGLYMDGQLWGLTGGFFGVLKFMAGAAIGLPYVVARTMDFGVGDITSARYEYGTTYLYTAGLLNMLLVVDTFDIAMGRKK